jgi:hypothetical protein
MGNQNLCRIANQDQNEHRITPFSLSCPTFQVTDNSFSRGWPDLVLGTVNVIEKKSNFLVSAQCAHCPGPDRK